MPDMSTRQTIAGRAAHLASGVDDVAVILDTIVVNCLLESGLDGRVIGFDEVVVDELNDERGLSYAHKSG